MKSNLLMTVVQAELPLVRTPEQVDVPIELVRSKKSSGAAFTLACDCSGMEDKEIYMPLKIDAGYFSRMKKGDATLQGDLLKEFCDHVGNNIYPEWLVYQLGCTMVQIETETQRLLRAEQEARKETEKENVLLRNLLVGKV